MSTAKIRVIFSTTIEPGVLQKLDAFCASTRRTRSDIFRGLLNALFLDEGERVTAPCDPPVKENVKDVVLTALKQEAGKYLRAGKLEVLVGGRVSRASMFRALTALVASGDVEKVDGRASGMTWTRGSLYKANLK
jgi:hypothetical protein